MGKRCRWAALGATFALLVAACAAPTSSETSSTGSPPRSNTGSAESAAPPSTESSDSSQLSTDSPVEFPESLANASFLQPAGDGTCATTNHSAISVFDPATGEPKNSLAIPRPAPALTVEGTTAFLAFGFDQGQQPGLGAVDLDEGAPLWQRFLDSEPQELKVVDGTLIAVTLDDVRAIDPQTGDDLWILDSQFEIRSIEIGSEELFALDQVGVHAIDPMSGEVVWQLPIERPDTLAVSDDFLAVASRTRIIGVDTNAQQRLFDINVDRSGNDGIWIASETVVHELSALDAPGGGLAAIDQRTGVERWRDSNIGETVFTGSDVLVASTANAEPNPGPPFVLVGLNANTGETLWESPSTAQVFDAVIGATPDRLAISQPHRVLSGLASVQLLDSRTGETVWEVATDLDVDAAAIAIGDFATLYGASSIIGRDRGTVSLRGTASGWWSASTSEGILQPPILSAAGLVVVSGERSPACAARTVGEPVRTQVLGTTQSDN